MSGVQSFRLKLERACEHLQAFEVEAKRWIEIKPYGVIDEPDPHPRTDELTYPSTRQRRFRVVRADPVPGHLSLIAGDCVHNLRSALDHLALKLGETFTPGMTHRQIRGSEFPIFFERPMSPDEEAKRIGCIGPGARDFIKAMQPHCRGDQYRTDPLWQIHEFDRIDKHRTLTACLMLPMADGQEYVGVGGLGAPDGNIAALTFVDSIGGEMKIDAVMLRYTAFAKDPNRDVKLQPALSVQVAFAETSAAARQAVVPTLRSLCDFVRDGVIAPLSEFL